MRRWALAWLLPVALGTVACSARQAGSTPAASPAKAGAVATVDLIFSGGITGRATQAINTRPVKTGAQYDYHSPDWATQCVMPAGDGAWDDGAWSANITFRLNAVTWQVSISEPGSGLPSAGSHPAVQETVTNDVGGSVSIAVTSNKSADGQSSLGATQYSYYTPMNHNSGTAKVTINPGLTSGTLDIWLTPDVPNPLVFHITGHWSCTP